MGTVSKLKHMTYCLGSHAAHAAADLQNDITNISSATLAPSPHCRSMSPDIMVGPPILLQALNMVVHQALSPGPCLWCGCEALQDTTVACMDSWMHHVAYRSQAPTATGLADSLISCCYPQFNRVYFMMLAL